MANIYSYITYAQARQQLANRLYDSTKQFWSDTELGRYLFEALRTWNALTSFWRGDFTFQSQTGITWYDLTDVINLPNTLRPLTVADTDIYIDILNSLLEPTTGPTSTQFTTDDITNAVVRCRNEILSVTGCTTMRRTIGAVAGRIALPDVVIDVRRVAYLPAVGSPSTMWPDDVWGEQSFEQAYLQLPAGTPLTYLLSTEPPISFDVDRAPGSAGSYELLTVEVNDALSGVGTTSLASDSFTRANQNPANTNWKSLQGNFVAGQVLNNQFTGLAGRSCEMLYDGGISWPANQYSRATLVALNPVTGDAVLSVREHIGSVSADGDGYAFVIDAGTSGGIGLPTPCEINIKVGGNTTDVVFGTVTPKIGDVFMISVIGNVITAYQSGLPIPGMHWSDSSVVSGNPGIGASPVTGVAGDVAWTNWDAGLATSSGLLIPDDWTHILKWGALADLLSRESNAKDSLRAKYCEQRYRMGMSLLSKAAALLAMRIGNQVMQVDSVRAADTYRTSWQAETQKKPDTAFHAGLNLVALASTPDAGPYSCTATVVQNAPLPTSDTDNLQVAREDLDAILDCAQHIAAFKMGGAEFLSTLPLLERFFKQASLYNAKLAEMGEYTEALYGLSQRQEQQAPRMIPTEDDTNG